MGASFWAKVDSDLDSNPKIRRGGRAAREVFLFVLRKNAARGATGSIPADYLELDYLADQLMMPREEAETGIRRAIEVRLIALVDDDVAIVGWDNDHARGPLSEAERKRAQRARQKSQSSPPNVTPCPDVSGQSRDVRTVTDQRERSERGERETPARAPDPSSTEHVHVPGTGLVADPETVARRKLGDRAWDHMNRLRAQLSAELGLAGVLPLGEHDPGRRELAERIVEAGDRARAQVAHAFAVLEHEARTARSIEWLAGKTFGAKAWARLLSQPAPPTTLPPRAPARSAEPTLEEREAAARARMVELEAENRAREARQADPNRVRVTPAAIRIRGGGTA